MEKNLVLSPEIFAKCESCVKVGNRGMSSVWLDDEDGPRRFVGHVCTDDPACLDEFPKSEAVNRERYHAARRKKR